MKCDMDKKHPIQLIVQYYRSGDPARQEEIDSCLRNNLANPLISVVHLLTEEQFDFSSFPNDNKIVQTVVGERLTYERAFRYANQVDQSGEFIWILSNADIYFDNTLQFLASVDFSRQVFALTRHNINSDGNIEIMPPEYAHGSQDVWIFTVPLPLERMFTAFRLGIPGCDHRIAHEFVDAGYIVINPSLKLIARHLDLASGVNLDDRTSKYVALSNESSYLLGTAASPPYQYFLFPTELLSPSINGLYAEVLSLYKDRHDLLCAKAHLESERAILESERAILESERAGLEVYIAALEARIESDQAQYSRSIHEMMRYLQGKEQQITAYENSLSWRVTKPLRRLGEVFAVAAEPPPAVDPAAGTYLDIDRFAELVTAHKAKKTTVLILDFNLGGGSNLYSRGLIAELELIGHKVFLLEYRYGLKDFHVEYNIGSGMAELAFTGKIGDTLPDLVAKMAVDVIVVSQLVSWPNTTEVLAVITSMAVPYNILLHDYFLVCPNWTLFDYTEHYCGVPADPEVCAACLKGLRKLDIPLNHHTSNQRIEKWRSSAGAFLVAADRVICFSGASSEVIVKAYPYLDNLLLLEHGIPESQLFRWQERSYYSGETLTVAVIGGISLHKGSRLIAQLVSDQRMNCLPVRVVIIGDILPLPATGADNRDKLVVHGGYIRQELPTLLDQYHASVVLTPSLWPETFCFTASEALLLGYPVICSDIGAPADRVSRYDAGWVIVEPFLDGIISLFQQIVEAPQLVAEKSRNAKEYQPMSADEHFLAISDLLNSTK